MDKEVFKKVESRLFNYFIDLKLIEKRKNKVDLLKKQQEEIKEEMRSLKALNIDSYTNMGIDYSKDPIQTSPSGSGEGETRVIKYITNLEKEHARKLEEMYKINADIREMELDIEEIRLTLQELDKEEFKLIELKYGKRKTFEWIGHEVCSAKSAIFKNIEKLVNRIGTGLGY